MSVRVTEQEWYLYGFVSFAHKNSAHFSTMSSWHCCWAGLMIKTRVPFQIPYQPPPSPGYHWGFGGGHAMRGLQPGTWRTVRVEVTSPSLGLPPLVGSFVAIRTFAQGDEMGFNYYKFCSAWVPQRPSGCQLSQWCQWRDVEAVDPFMVPWLSWSGCGEPEIQSFGWRPAKATTQEKTEKAKKIAPIQPMAQFRGSICTTTSTTIIIIIIIIVIVIIIIITISMTITTPSIQSPTLGSCEGSQQRCTLTLPTAWRGDPAGRDQYHSKMWVCLTIGCTPGHP